MKPPKFPLGVKVIPSVDECKYIHVGIIISIKNSDVHRFKKANEKMQMPICYYVHLITVHLM